MEEKDNSAKVGDWFELKRVSEKAARLQVENSDLKRNNELLSTRFDSHVETQSDMLRNLNQEINNHLSKIEELNAVVARLNEDLSMQKTNFEEELAEKESQWKSKYSNLQVRTEQLTRELSELHNFRRTKDTMEDELAKLKREAERMMEAHNTTISEFERRKAIDRDNLKKDWRLKVDATQEILLKKTREQVDQTTKRTIMENEQMVTELHFHNKETERLISSNNKLLEENAQLKRNLQIHKDLENELARRTHVYQKLIKKMDQKQKSDLASKEQSKDLRVSDSMDQELSTMTDVTVGTVPLQLSRELPSVTAARELPVTGGTVKLSDEVERVRKQLDAAESRAEQVRQEYAHYKRDHATLTQLQDQSTRLIISALYELRQERAEDQFPPAPYDENADWAFANMTPKQKEYFFRVLLEKLNSSLCLSCVPSGPGLCSSPSLPSVHKPSQHQASVDQGGSKFLWSMSTMSGGPSMQVASPSRRELVTKSVQTETTSADPCFKEGLWNSGSRSKFGDSPMKLGESPMKRIGSSPLIKPGVVAGGMRTMGPKTMSHRTVGLSQRLV